MTIVSLNTIRTSDFKTFSTWQTQLFGLIIMLIQEAVRTSFNKFKEKTTLVGAIKGLGPVVALRL